MSARKLVLAVVDGMAPAMLGRAIAEGRAPALRAIAERGTLIAEGAAAAFPSVTPVCAGAIGTGALQDVHHIPSLNWWSRAERRYVEYGSSLRAAYRFGIARQLTDTVFNMNMEHLSPDATTVFEALDDAGVRTAGTTYLIYRGRHRHDVSRELALSRIAAALWRRSVLGPAELFYADMFASRETGCRSQMGLPGMRDRHAGCVAEHLVANDLFDFLLLSLPDNDNHSHRYGPMAQGASIAEADRQIVRMMDAGGGVDRFLDDHAMIVVADHSHAPIARRCDLGDAFSSWTVMGPGARTRDAEIALCPNARAAMVYVLVDEARERLARPLAEAGLASDGVELAMFRCGGEAVVLRSGPPGRTRRELRFAAGGDVRDERGAAWSVEGDLSVLSATVRDGALRTPEYPNALARVWAALHCPTSGDVLLSAAPGWEFADWGGVDHVGGGSHGSLHVSDSMGALAFCGVRPPHDHGAWSIADMTPMVRAHFDA
ncbi:MAG TPA: alkaline phosphatase family protein [Solirubrobacteraceae bacterium]|nr:alkaline phosphatase family protein [Solirubrobacteraceae bacterium]